MTDPTHYLIADALRLAAAGVPVLPLREGKGPLGNCRACEKISPTRSRCGGRPNMRAPGPCECPRPCHAWAAASTDRQVILSRPWLDAWREARAVGYHPGGAGLTVLDLDHADAVAWAREHMPPTRTVATTRGEHWVYLGAMPSSNGVRPGVDVKSLMQYARWLGTGTGTMTRLTDAVRALVVRAEEANPAPIGGRLASSSPAPWSRNVATGCRHTERYVTDGLNRGLAKIRALPESGAGSQTFGVARFLAAQHAHCPGPCGLDAIAAHLIAAAASVGVPDDYAARAVTRGFEAANSFTSNAR
ncbi:bifunctional DNA primase/polymerase [Kitasatospora sp. NA04385]|uniref:bifunctional DNA primase/polymerase n=1 Tax=Kitasatospora sp. NA04385 TaxID=2742135 RepID=UPI00159142D1|nr:bifunctional DNA primase/polymerase [Kitasatospora sp. NA04385]QKW20493.1 bifunctional DNA primase/polymerase [Kitasatospora sp. NA04385]